MLSLRTHAIISGAFIAATVGDGERIQLIELWARRIYPCLKCCKFASPSRWLGVPP